MFICYPRQLCTSGCAIYDNQHALLLPMHRDIFVLLDDIPHSNVINFDLTPWFNSVPLRSSQLEIVSSRISQYAANAPISLIDRFFEQNRLFHCELKTLSYALIYLK